LILSDINFMLHVLDSIWTTWLIIDQLVFISFCLSCSFKTFQFICIYLWRDKGTNTFLG
jgi:hypothetical protein